MQNDTRSKTTSRLTFVPTERHTPGSYDSTLKPHLPKYTAPVNIGKRNTADEEKEKFTQSTAALYNGYRVVHSVFGVWSLTSIIPCK